MTKSELDEERFANILGKSNNIITAGNIKFQERKSKDSVKIIKELENVKFFLAASTHKGEEEIIISWFDCEMAGFDKLIFVPRHIERAAEIKEIIEKHGYTASLYSENDFTKQVMIVDAFGLLEGLYISADKIFIGGSLKKIGGHNIYEALQFEKTVAVGKYMFSFKEIFDEAKEFGLVTVINNKEEALQFLSKTEKNIKTISDTFKSHSKESAAWHSKIYGFLPVAHIKRQASCCSNKCKNFRCKRPV